MGLHDVGAQGPADDKPGWVLTFSDEFEGEQLDLAKWNPGDPWGAERNRELQAYVPDAFRVSAGVLRIVAERRSAFYSGKERSYTSGMMTTYQKFAQRYGWFEIRCRAPRGRGLWPAFWLLPEPLGWPPEIDVLEILGHETQRVHMTHHWRDAAGTHRSEGGSFSGPDFAADFHTFAVEWTPDLIRWYVDGIERYRATQPVPQGPMYMLVNLAVGGNWPGSPDEQTPFPSSFDVDYVRVYRRG
ncbi:MAG TPA: glycoside hydrolase family 16 protein [Limnochordia bacterium]